MALRLPRVRDLTHPRVAVLLTAATAAVAVATGIGALANEAFARAVTPVPVVGVVNPDVRRTAAFTGTLVGFLLLLSARGLRRGSRLGRLSALAFLPFAALLGLLQSNPLSVPQIVLALVTLFAVVRNRRAFDRPSRLTGTQQATAVAVVGSQLYATLGAWVLREQFSGVETPVEAFYFALVTASTVGYGDVTPATDVARLFATSAIVIGTASFAAAAGSLLVPAIEARFATSLGTMTDRNLSLLEDHVVVAGYGDMTEPIIEELADSETEFAVVVEEPDDAAALRERDYLVYVGDPSDEDPLLAVGVERARAVVAATDDDAADALAVLTARELNPGVRIVAGASDRENVKKLKRAGADTVISPAVLGGHLLVRSALGTGGMEALAERLLDATDVRDL
ncbi:NAD-binding protein [Halomarina halobia]|uniref:NAD-binding protein n=1 Tax=Halomarina halobia TaxID=3033386 RepID=A0ABD6A7M9_9EURY|nr:NAD-binding protein [Halomarina sp. PSR21]